MTTDIDTGNTVLLDAQPRHFFAKLLGADNWCAVHDFSCLVRLVMPRMTGTATTKAAAAQQNAAVRIECNSTYPAVWIKFKIEFMIVPPEFSFL